MSMITSAAIDAYLTIDSVEVVGRHRKDLGDVGALARSIQEVGLLHPITLTRDGRLIAGQRRLEACRLLVWTDIPVRFADNLDDATKLLHAERDENTCRKDMLPSEKAALGASLQAIEVEAARDRQGTRTDLGRQLSGDVSTTSNGGKTRDAVGEALGMSGRTYDYLHNAHALANDPTAPTDERTLARETLEAMDREGRIWEPGKKLTRKLRAKRETREVIEASKAAADLTPKVLRRGLTSAAQAAQRRDRMRDLAPQGYTSAQIGNELGISPETVRLNARKYDIDIPADRALGKSQRRINPNRVVRETVHALEGLAMGVGLIDGHLDGLDPAEISNWAASLTHSIQVINRLAKQLKEMAQ